MYVSAEDKLKKRTYEMSVFKLSNSIAITTITHYQLKCFQDAKQEIISHNKCKQ